MMISFLSRRAVLGALAAAVVVSAQALATPVAAQATAFKQAVAEAAAKDKAIAAFYRDTGYAPIWTGKGNRDKQRRQALLKAISNAGDHGLPETRYDAKVLKTNLRRVKSDRDLGRLEVEMSRIFLQYAQDVQSGVIANPRRIDAGIARSAPRRDRAATLAAFAKNSPATYLKSLPPQHPEYARLMKEKLRLEKMLGKRGWGPEVPAGKLAPGSSGPAVVALRNRLVAMGYMKRSASGSYDSRLQKGVMAFQRAHGLTPDGVAGKATIAEINQPIEKRLSQIVVSMERERWLNINRGERYVWVNAADFSTRLIERGKTVYQSISIVGKRTSDRQTPEFSDEMEHMVINPTWYVPRSIATKLYLPQLKKNPYAQSRLKIVDSSGRVVDRSATDFTQFSRADFPYSISEPPNPNNALGLVKFMFPNKYNIYLHDTPTKQLFGREQRDFSWGCVRLQKPFEFAYQLLSKQTADPEGFFQAKLATGVETQVNLKKPVPVHLIYRTAFTTPKGAMNYRRDVYGRDAKIFKALRQAGVALRAVQS